MDQALAQLQALIRDNEIRAVTEARGRRRLLWIAALVTTGISVGFLASLPALTSSASFTPARFALPGWPWTMAALAAVGGLGLAAGLVRRRLGWQFSGLLCITAFYALMLGIFAVNNADWVAVWWVDSTAPGRWMAAHQWPLTPLSDDLRERAAGPRPAVYPVFVYLHMTVAMATHARTTWKLRRAEVVS